MVRYCSGERFLLTVVVPMVMFLLISVGADNVTNTLLYSSSFWRIPEHGLYLIVSLTLLYTFALFPNGKTGFLPPSLDAYWAILAINTFQLSTMWCRGAIHGALWDASPPQAGAMNCAPTPPLFETY